MRFVVNHYGTYQGSLRDLCHAVKQGERSAIIEVGVLLSDMLPKGSIIVPAPSRNGRASTQLDLANVIVDNTDGVSILDCVNGASRESFYNLKKVGRYRLDMGFRSQYILSSPKVVILDSVVDTGTTLTQLFQATGAFNGLCLARA